MSAMRVADQYMGLYRGVVVATNDPDSNRRVRLRVPAVLGTANSHWAEPSYPTAVVPSVGTNLWVSFNNGEPSRPVWFSGPVAQSASIFTGSLSVAFVSGTKTIAHGCPFTPAFIALEPHLTSSVALGVNTFDATNMTLDAYINSGGFTGTLTVRFACIGTPTS